LVTRPRARVLLRATETGGAETTGAIEAVWMVTISRMPNDDHEKYRVEAVAK